MMMSEFIDRTGFEPTAKEYAKIEEAYYDFDGDKDAFCKAFVKDGGGAEALQGQSRRDRPPEQPASGERAAVQEGYGRP